MRTPRCKNVARSAVDDWSVRCRTSNHHTRNIHSTDGTTHAVASPLGRMRESTRGQDVAVMDRAVCKNCLRLRSSCAGGGKTGRARIYDTRTAIVPTRDTTALWFIFHYGNKFSPTTWTCHVAMVSTRRDEVAVGVYDCWRCGRVRAECERVPAHTPFWRSARRDECIRDA